jgi:3-hydroxyisobutyrate dehydrogenase-like beta-hydroxyacid dehydrogenase
VLASGPEAARERCGPVFDAIGRRTVWLGEAAAEQFDRGIEAGHGDEDMAAAYYAARGDGR